MSLWLYEHVSKSCLNLQKRIAWLVINLDPILLFSTFLWVVICVLSSVSLKKNLIFFRFLDIFSVFLLWNSLFTCLCPFLVGKQFQFF